MVFRADHPNDEVSRSGTLCGKSNGTNV